MLDKMSPGGLLSPCPRCKGFERTLPRILVSKMFSETIMSFLEDRGDCCNRWRKRVQGYCQAEILTRVLQREVKL